MKKPYANQGSILVAVIWVVSLLSIFAVFISYAVQGKILLVGRMQDNEEIHFIAEAGVKRALLQLAIDKYTVPFTNLSLDCGNNPTVFKDIPIGRGSVNVGSALVYGFTDEEQRLNVNTCDCESLSRLLEWAGELNESAAKRVALAIIDYRDVGNVTVDGLSKDAVYQASGCPVKKAPFETLPELRLVLGVTPALYSKIKDYLTVYGLSQVNINTTPSYMFSLLGLDEGLIRKILSFRAGPDGQEGTDDDRFVDDISSYIDTLQTLYPLNNQEKQTLKDFILSGKVGTKSHYVHIYSRGYLPFRKKIDSIECVYDVVTHQCLYWQERILSQDPQKKGTNGA